MALLLITSTNPENYQAETMLVESASRKNLEVKKIFVDELPIDDIFKFKTTKEDILYRLQMGVKAKMIELSLTLRNSEFRPRSFFIPSNNIRVSLPWGETVAFQMAGIPIIPTLYLDALWKDFSEEELNSRLDAIDGFPAVLKRTGLSHGKGVRLIQNPGELKDLLSSLEDNECIYYVLRKYIEDYRHARLIVLGDRVIDRIEYIKPANDFRTNATDTPQVKPAKFSDEIEAIAVAASKIKGREFGGADVLIDKISGKPYLAELNYPCNFARAQEITGTNISDQMIDYLLAK